MLLKCRNDVTFSSEGVIADNDRAGEQNHHVAGQFSLMKEIGVLRVGDNARLTDEKTFLNLCL